MHRQTRTSRSGVLRRASCRHPAAHGSRPAGPRPAGPRSGSPAAGLRRRRALRARAGRAAREPGQRAGTHHGRAVGRGHHDGQPGDGHRHWRHPAAQALHLPRAPVSARRAGRGRRRRGHDGQQPRRRLRCQWPAGDFRRAGRASGDREGRRDRRRRGAGVCARRRRPGGRRRGARGPYGLRSGRGGGRGAAGGLRRRQLGSRGDLRPLDGDGLPSGHRLRTRPRPAARLGAVGPGGGRRRRGLHALGHRGRHVPQLLPALADSRPRRSRCRCGGGCAHPPPAGGRAPARRGRRRHHVRGLRLGNSPSTRRRAASRHRPGCSP